MSVGESGWFATKSIMQERTPLLTVDYSMARGPQLSCAANCIFARTATFMQGKVAVYDELWTETGIDSALLECVARGLGLDPTVYIGDFEYSYQEGTRMDAASLFLAAAVSGREIIVSSADGSAWVFFDHHYLLYVYGDQNDDLDSLCSILLDIYAHV